MSPLRRRINDSYALAWIVATLVGGYLWLCQRTTRWEIIGRDALEADLNEGPVLLVMWHARLLLAPYHWPLSAGQLTALNDTSPIGRSAGELNRRLGLRPMQMSASQSNTAASRQILRRIKEGASIGLTGDGPKGPALLLKDAPLDWARVIQRPVYVYAYATRAHRRLGTWDKMFFPLPFTRGRVVYTKWVEAPPRKVAAPEAARLRASLGDLMRETTEMADAVISDR